MPSGPSGPSAASRGRDDVTTAWTSLWVEWRVTQKQLASEPGISLRELQTLERGKLRSPLLRELVNIASALGVKLEDVIEDEWLRAVKLTFQRTRRISRSSRSTPSSRS